MRNNEGDHFSQNPDQKASPSPETPKESFKINEDRVKGKISLKSLQQLIEGTGGYTLYIFYTVLYLLINLAQASALKQAYAWGTAFYSKIDPKNDSSLVASISLKFAFLTASYLVSGLIIFLSVVWLGRAVHSRMFFRLVHSRLHEFLQRISNGIIINRFSEDINSLDTYYAGRLSEIFTLVSGFIVSFYEISNTLNSWLALTPCALFIILGYLQRVRFMDANREVVRLRAISKSPVIGLISGSASGGPVVRVLGLQGYFRGRLDHKIEENAQNCLMAVGLRFWFCFVLIFLTNFCVLVPLNMLLVYRVYSVRAGGAVDGLASFLSFVQSFSRFYQNLLIQSTDVESFMVSVERCVTYEGLAWEDGYQDMEQKRQELESLTRRKAKKAKKQLIQDLERNEEKRLYKEGRIRFEGVYARYPSSCHDVIRGLDLEIEKGQKVAIIGQSGAGKSSVITLLWRALTPHEGTITIDGIPINTIDIKEHRKEIVVVQQKPSIFEGTLLSNITPGRVLQYQIRQIRAQLLNLGFDKQKLASEDLDYKIEPEGRNLTQSEKQVISVVQSLQKRASVVILDEINAYIDAEIQKKILEALWNHFSNSTIIIIAHRLGGVEGLLDRVIQLHEGKVVRDGSVEEILYEEQVHKHRNQEWI